MVTFKNIKERLLNGALSLYSKYGIKSITMDDISRELGVSKKTIYQHFSDKNNLIRDVINYEKEMHQRIMKKMILSDLNAIDELIHANKQIHMSQSIHSPTFYFDLKKYYPEIYNDWISYKRDRMYEIIHRNLQKGIREGLYRKDLDIDLISRLHMARTEMMYSSDLISHDEVSNARFIDEVFKYHIHGICNSDGLSYFEKKIEELNVKNN